MDAELYVDLDVTLKVQGSNDRAVKEMHRSHVMTYHKLQLHI